MTKKQTPLTMCHASATAQTASRQRGTAPVRVCCKKTLTDSSQNTQKQMNGPHQRLAWYSRSPLSTSNSASASETAKVNRLNR